jgi:hypothetical protein
LIDLIPTFVVDYARFVSGALPIGVGERFAIRISCHLLSPDALQPTITVRLPVSYCCPGDPVFAPDMSNMDVSQPEDDDAPTYYRQVLNIPDEISNFIYTPTSWTMSGTAGVEIVPKDHGGIFPLEALADLGPTCRYFVFDVDVSSGPSCVVSIELTYYHNDGTVGAHTFLKEDGTFTPFDYFIPAGFTGHITSVQLSASALRYIGLTVVLQTAGSESASVSNPTYSPQITDTFYWVNEGT